MNQSTKQTQTHRHREQPDGCQGGDGELGVWDKPQGPTEEHGELQPVS